MSEPKSFASLSPGLLARKGAAKPALRHQLNPKQADPSDEGDCDVADQVFHEAGLDLQLGQAVLCVVHVFHIDIGHETRLNG